MSKFWRTISWAIVITLSPLTDAGEKHPLSDIATKAALEMQHRAAEQGYNNVDVKIRPIDNRLNLSACKQNLELLPSRADRALGPVSVGIRCPGNGGWTLYIRGQVTASIELPILTKSVARGELLSSRDFTLQPRKINNNFGGVVSDPTDIIGKEARYNLSAGNELRFNDLKTPVTVERGQEVSIVSGGTSLRVSMQGKALSAGGTGDRILVRNVKTGKRLEGIVYPDGSVIVN